MIIPKNTIFNQNNRGSDLGDLWASKNIDLSSNLGVLRLSPRMILNINTADDAQFDAPACAFRFFTTPSYFVWAIAGKYVWNSTGGTNTAFTQDGTANTPTSCSSDTSDIEQLGTNLFFTQSSTTIKYLDSTGVWNSASGTLNNASGLHQMTKFRAQNRIYVVDGNATGISSIIGTTITASSTYSLQNLVDGTFVKISWIKASSNRVWIGTIDYTGAPAKVYAWDGVQNSGANEEYVLSANGSLACVIKDDQPVLIDTKGRLLQLNGSTFTEFARLPFEESDTPTTYFTTATNRLVHYNGMTVVKDKINILVNTVLYDADYTIKERVPSGIWEWTSETGLYHKASLGLSKAGATITDFGGSALSAVGALQEIDTPSNSITRGSINGKMLCSATYYTSATATSNGIWYDDTKDTERKAGYFVTSWLRSENLKDSITESYARIRPLLNSTDKITFKSRITEDDPLVITGTWASTTTFNTTTDLRDYEGYEVEVLRGTGGSQCAHITNITINGASGWLITLDKAFTGVTTGTFKARIQNWTKIAEFSTQSEDIAHFPSQHINPSSRFQLKVCLEWTLRNELYDILINNQKYQ